MNIMSLDGYLKVGLVGLDETAVAPPEAQPMTLANPQAPGSALFWGLAAAGSLALHLGLSLGLFDPAALPSKPPAEDTAGVTGPSCSTFRT